MTTRFGNALSAGGKERDLDAKQLGQTLELGPRRRGRSLGAGDILTHWTNRPWFYFQQSELATLPM